MPAGEGRVVRAREVVHAGVHGAVDLLDQAGDQLDPLPALAAGGVGRPRRLQVTRPHGVREGRRRGDGLVHLLGHVVGVLRRGAAARRGAAPGSLERQPVPDALPDAEPEPEPGAGPDAEASRRSPPGGRRTRRPSRTRPPPTPAGSRTGAEEWAGDEPWRGPPGTDWRRSGVRPTECGSVGETTSAFDRGGGGGGPRRPRGIRADRYCLPDIGGDRGGIRRSPGVEQGWRRTRPTAWPSVTIPPRSPRSRGGARPRRGQRLRRARGRPGAGFGRGDRQRAGARPPPDQGPRVGRRAPGGRGRRRRRGLRPRARSKTRPPPPLGRRGRGLWIIRQLTDLVAISSGADGTTVRIELSPDPHIGALTP